MSEQQLKPCPGCGKSARHERVRSADGEQRIRVGCSECWMATLSASDTIVGRGFVGATWNKRVLPPAVAGLVAVCREAEKRLGEFMMKRDTTTLTELSILRAKLRAALAELPEGQL